MRSPMKKRPASDEGSPTKNKIEIMQPPAIDVNKIFSDHQSTQMQLKNQTAEIKILREDFKDKIDKGQL